MIKGFRVQILPNEEQKQKIIQFCHAARFAYNWAIAIEEQNYQNGGKFISGYTYKYVEDLPQIIESNIVYIVGENDFYWMLGFECPCGCHSTINLNLLDDTFPSWKYTIFNNNLITLRPSIRRVNGCKSHFFIKKSRLVWV